MGWGDNIGKSLRQGSTELWIANSLDEINQSLKQIAVALTKLANNSGK